MDFIKLQISELMRKHVEKENSPLTLHHPFYGKLDSDTLCETLPNKKDISIKFDL